MLSFVRFDDMGSYTITIAKELGKYSLLPQLGERLGDEGR